ncbi:MAG: sensor histidine kinase, partial [Hyphomonadaceae bacterium]
MTTAAASPIALFRGDAAPYGPARVRLRTLILLRWLAVIGQLAAVLFVQFALGFKLPLAAALTAIAVSALLNVALMATRSTQTLVHEAEAAAQLAYDVAQLAVLLA